jgi:AraC family transcriptional regulator of adaptative response/methylated-DNA-[protein]-cysteine methyltransferase
MKDSEEIVGDPDGLNVSLVSATREEICNGGAGLEIRWGVSESPFGSIFLAQSPRGITHLSFFDGDEAESLDFLHGDWPAASLLRDDGLVRKISSAIFTDRAHDFRLHLKGTPFQLKVWKALLDIPEGELSTYGRLAKKLRMDGAARAVGNAVGKNRIAYLIPCHRVIRENGDLGGYRWGMLRKREMLSRERAHTLTPR